MRETAIHREIAIMFKDIGQHLYLKIPDMPRSATSRFIPEKPFDILVFTSEGNLAIEAKLISRSRRRSGKITGHSSWHIGGPKEEDLNDWNRIKRQASNLVRMRIFFNTLSLFLIGIRGRFRMPNGNIEHKMELLAIMPDVILQMMEDNNAKHELKLSVPLLLSIGIPLIREKSIWQRPSWLLQKGQYAEIIVEQMEKIPSPSCTIQTKKS